MSTHKHIDAICVAVLVFCLLLTVLFMNGKSLGLEMALEEESEESFTENELDGAWDAEGATVITLRGDTASVSGGGAYSYGGKVVISSAGRFVLSGTLSDGSVTVDATKGAKVWLLFDGVDISCSDDACLKIEQAKKVFLTLAEGSENRLSGGASQKDGSGVLFARDDLAINGSGALSITAAYRHGIDANDELAITGGSLTVSAPADAIHVNDALRLCQARLELSAGDDGIAVTAEDGTLLISSGELSITAQDDAIHTGGDISIEGGSLSLSAGDDGVHSDAGVSLSGGKLLISPCYEGIEALTIDISGGETEIYPTDDGLNANGGAGYGNYFGAPQQALDTWVHISGGSLTIVNTTGQDADGLDSNGDILMTGGTVRVSLLGSGTNSAIDYGSESGGVCQISGGSIIACGSYSMAEGFDSGSAQCSVLYNLSEGAAAGTELSLEDASGNTLVSYTVPCAFSSVVLSVPEMELGGSYRLVLGDEAEELTLNEISASYGDAQSSMFGGRMNWGGLSGRDGGRGGFGERSGNGDKPEMGGFPGDGEQPEMGGFPGDGEQPEMGGFPGNGERPEMGGFPGDGEQPEMGGFPGNGEQPEMGGFPGSGDRPEMGEFLGMPDENEPETAQEAAGESSGSLGAETWLWLGASVLALAAALVFALRFRRRR